VGAEENLQELLIANNFTIVSDLDDLGMASLIGAYLFIRGILHMSSAIARDHAFYALQILENGFQTPKATST
jgi:hypothetical protein